MKFVAAAAGAAVALAGLIGPSTATAQGPLLRQQGPESEISVEEAVARALAANPATRASGQSIAAAQAARIQAGVRPVDQLEVDVENPISTNGVFRDTELTVALARTFERGGKREARIAVAEREIEVAQANALVRRLDLAQAVEQAYVDALIADVRIIAAESQLDIERTLTAEAERRVRGYKDPLFVGTRARARVTEAEVNLRRAQQVRDGAYAALAAMIGADPDQLRLDEAGFLRPPVIGPAAIASADLVAAEAEIARADAVVALERTRSVRDFTVRGGIKATRETNDLGLVAGIRLPLGTGRANRGNVERALAERERARLDAEALRLVRERRISALRASAEAARTEALAIDREVLPRLQQALVQVREGYARGGFSFADIQDQARALFEARNRMIEALIRHHEARAELDRLTGRFARLENVQ